MAKAKKKKEEDMMIETGNADMTEEIVMEEAAVEENAAEEVVPEEESPAPEVTTDDVRLVEAILFASSTAVSEAMIAERFPQGRAALIPEILEHLKEHYATRGVTLVQRDKRWALRTASDLGDQMRLEKEQPKKFTRAAMETMAIIAYHQPVTRAEIENIRGVATSPGALDTLMEAGWIKPGKRREVPGRPVTWLSTQGFLDHFGLEKIQDLPGMDELKAAGLLDKRPAIEAMPTADLFDESESRKIEDPQEITDEDLIGRQDSDNPEENEASFAPKASAGGDDEEDDLDEDEDDLDEDDFDDEESEDSEESEDDEELDDEDSDDEEDDEDYDDEDEDGDDDDFDDEDDEDDEEEKE